MATNKSGRGRRTTPTSSRTRRSRPPGTKAAGTETLKETAQAEETPAFVDSDSDSFAGAGAGQEAFASAEGEESDGQSTLTSGADDSMAADAGDAEAGGKAEDDLAPPGAHRLTADDILSDDNLADSSSADSLAGSSGGEDLIEGGTSEPLIEVTAKEVPENDDDEVLASPPEEATTASAPAAAKNEAAPKSEAAKAESGSKKSDEPAPRSGGGSGSGGGRQPPALPPAPPPSSGGRSNLLKGIVVGGVLVVLGYILAVGTSDLWMGKVVSPEDWNQQQQKIAALTKSLGDLEAKVSSVPADSIAALDSGQQTLSKNVVDLTKKIGEVGARVDKLAQDSGDGTAQSEALQKLNDEIAAARAAGANLQKQLGDALKAAQEKVSTALAGGKSGLESLGKELSDLQAEASKRLEDLGKRLTSLEAEKGPDPEVAKQMEEVRSQIEGLRAAVSQNETKTSTILARLTTDPKALEDSVKALQTKAQGLASDLTALGEKASKEVSALADSLGGKIDQEVAKLGTSLASADSEIKALGGKVAALEKSGPELQQGLDSLKKTSGEIGQQLTALKDQIDSFAGQLNDRIDSEIQAALAKDMRPRAAALALATAQLNDAVQQGGSFEGAFEAVEKLAGSAPELQADLASLKPLATAGVSSPGGLLSSFRAQIPKILAAADGESQDDGDLLDNAWGAVSSLVEVRPVGEISGETAKAIVARAEQRLQAGNLTDAVSEVASLKGAAATAAAPWLTEARARLLALQATERLQQTALASLAAQQN